MLRRRRNIIMSSGLGCINSDPHFSNVIIHMDFEVNNTANAGSMADATATGFTRNTSSPIHGDGDATVADSDDLLFADFSPEVGSQDWTFEFTFQGTWPTSSTVDDVWSQYQETGDNRSFVLSVQEDGGGHEMTVAMSNDGATNQEPITTHVQAVSLTNDIVTTLAWQRESDKIHYHKDGIFLGSTTLLSGASFSVFNTAAEHRIGTRQVAGATTLVGNWDRIRATVGTARFGAVNYSLISQYSCSTGTHPIT